MLLMDNDISHKETYFKTIDIYGDEIDKYRDMVNKGDKIDYILIEPSHIFEGCCIVDKMWASKYTHETKKRIRFTYMRTDDNELRFKREKILEQLGIK